MKLWHGGRPRPRPDCVRWGPMQLPSPKRDTAPHVILGPFLLCRNRWMDEDATWYGGRPQPRRHCVGWAPSSRKKGQSPPIFNPCLLWPNSWMDQDGTWHGGGHRSRPHCARWGPSSPPQFLPISIVAKWLDASRCHLVRR